MIGLLALATVVGGSVLISTLEAEDEISSATDTDAPDPDPEDLPIADVSVLIDGTTADDTLSGGDANDTINGGGGNDWILSGGGNDSVSGGADDDRIALGGGSDIYGGDGVDESGNDTVRGGSGNDWLFDVTGADTLLGGLNEDTLIGAQSGVLDDEADLLGGGYGDDVILGDNGDTINGGEGVDTFGIGFEFGQGFDAVTITDFESTTEALTLAVTGDIVPGSLEWSVSLDEATGIATIDIWGNEDTGSGPVALPPETVLILENMDAASVAALNLLFADDLSEVESGTAPETTEVALTDGADTHTGTDADETVHGGAGDDTLSGGAGDDVITAGDGNDSVDGGEDDDRLVAGDGNDTISGGEGDDTVVGGDGNDFYGYDGATTTNEGGDDLVRGGQGDDWLQDAEGADTLYGGLGDDTVSGADVDVFDAEADWVSGGYGNDVVVGDNGDTLVGGEGHDEFGVGFDFGAGYDAVTITDLDAENEAITIAISSDAAVDNMDWSVSFDAATGIATIDIWGTEDSGSGPVAVPAETVLVLEGMTAEDVAALSIAFSY
ncbi:calcium-binding protein [Shimia sp. Alg240-R146]|uniref:calcium-binding protein n=1 Tax=Shimia sp. Alg240-R146 TaxID=2993449 RepID=UPI0022E77FC8|nr:calcium-binding protein [Shimia sp. Alg240-R146]